MPIELISNIAQKNRAANVSNTAFFYLMDTSNIDYRIAGIQNDSNFIPTLTDNSKYILRNTASLHSSFGSITGVQNNDIVICQSGLFYVYVDVSNSKTNQGGLVYNDADDKLYYYNGVHWKSLGLGSLVGTPDQIQITGSTGDVQIGLTPIVIVQNIIQTPILRFANGITMGSVGDIIQLTGNLNITGSLLVDGEVITKTAFSGYTLDSEVEPVVSVALDAGDY